MEIYLNEHLCLSILMCGTFLILFFFWSFIQKLIPKVNSTVNESIGDNLNCDQATNDMSSEGKIPQQPHKQPPSQQQQQQQQMQNSTDTNAETASTAEEDEDEDRRKTNHLCPYSLFNSTHNHYGNDDDDDCNSSEDTKSSCPSKCDSLKTEQQHNGQQQQVNHRKPFTSPMSPKHNYFKYFSHNF